ncbi:lysine biosynthesis protein LysX [Halarchaeum sp. CBA1220]|uniref:lysine biosynthesis protein LysX n=1 Tax=Halarchaeum sp. CBA1220 TaxID=1853682 RepID=UPI000F3AA742|nr:lysine biosynthesis protein LysX [Halarchaeum sp. CBA1220]QLC33669.1 lysine biosynthesis protein LysX [Halarchaeum sp. CBA1220]
MRLGFLYSRIRKDEKLLLDALEERGHDVVKVDVRDPQFSIGERPDELADLDLALNRCQESSRVRYVSMFCEHYDVPVVNGARATATCADKVRGSLALADADVPTPRTEVSFDVESALESVESFGYPCVIKPVTGSWGRLLAKIDTRDAAEAVLEHKQTLGSYEHSVFYVQEFVEKPGRDIRVVAADGEPIAAMTRSAEHWITNAARGGEAEAFEVDEEVRDLVERANDAVGGGLLGVDLMETGDGYTVHEVNATCEFKALNDAVPDVDVPARIVDWLEAKAEAAE